MNYGRVWCKGSGVVFGQSVFHVDGRHPKTTPDPVRIAYPRNKSNSDFFADPYACLRSSAAGGACSLPLFEPVGPRPAFGGTLGALVWPA